MSAPPKGCWCNGACPHIGPVRELEAAKRGHQAESAIRRRLLLAPDCPELHKAFARHLQARNHAFEAGEHLKRAAALAGESPELALMHAVNLRLQAIFPAAIEAADRALELAPDNPAAWVALGYALHASGTNIRAAAVVETALRKFGNGHGLRRLSAAICADLKQWQQAIEILTGADLQPIELLDRGRCKEQLLDYAGAWADWMEAKRIQRETEKLVYKPEAFARQIAELIDSSRPPRSAALRWAAGRFDAYSPGPRPIFITGFPRSGTTMLEASLSAHPLITAGDEMHALPELTAKAPAILSAAGEAYPRCLMALTWPENAHALELMAHMYTSAALARVVAPARNFAWFTDKMPSNELHMPFIAAMFPDSPIVHVRRHPLDVLVSCMSQFLVNGGHNACSLEWCAHHYALTDSLVAHYRKKVRPPMLREVRYEAFVADPRGVDSLLPKGLAPHPDCYEFHKNPWHSRTLSYRQIKEPAHAGSVGRFRPFLDFLRPILPLITPTLDREGYSL